MKKKNYNNFDALIHTKQNVFGKWYSFGTINGYDYSFEADTPWKAQSKMRDLLSTKNIVNVGFTALEYYKPQMVLNAAKTILNKKKFD